MNNLIVILLTLLVLSSCGKKANDNASTTASDADKKAFVENYANIVFANYEDSYNEALKMEKAIKDFLAAPDAEKMEIAKKAWIAAREPYGQTEAFRFAGGPIDDEDGPEGALNAWPLDENYVDYVRGSDKSGIINDPEKYPEIKAEILESLNEQGGEKNISIGYHAIEFLLWGQDDLDTKLKTPGKRPHTDFIKGGTAANQERRAEYLKATTEILIKNLKEMVDEWDPKGKDNYRSKLLAMDADEAIKGILTGIGTLSKSELAGERMIVALDNQDQEDEHSCFSDNTHRDIILNALGIANVIKGSYKRVDGSVISGRSLIDLVKVTDETHAKELEELATNTVKNTEAIPVPFDLALTAETVGGNGPIMTSVKALQKQGDVITTAASKLGIKIGTALPE